MCFVGGRGGGIFKLVSQYLGLHVAPLMYTAVTSSLGRLNLAQFKESLYRQLHFYFVETV